MPLRSIPGAGRSIQTPFPPAYPTCITEVAAWPQSVRTFQATNPQLGTGSETDFAFNFSIVAATGVATAGGVRKAHPADYSVTFGDVSRAR